jgi:TolB-like protein
MLFCAVCAQNVLSVLYFDNTTDDIEYQWLSKGLADMLISDLSDLPGIKIVERESLEKLLQEQALSLSGLTKDGPSDKIGQLLQADNLIYGSYITSDDEIRVDIKLSEVMSGKIVYTNKAQGDIDNIFDLQTQLVSGIREYFKLDEPQVPIQQETQSLSALASYYIGIDHIDNMRYSEAQSEFSRAIELDPMFSRAQEGLAESYKFLKAFKKHRQQREIAQLYTKIKILRERIEAPQWFTFADIVQSPQYRSMTVAQQQKWNATHNEYLICQTPAQCTWHVMLTMDEIGRKSADYFGNTDLQQKLWQQIIKIGDESRMTYADDPFLSEILYIQLLAFYSQKDYTQLKSRSEKFLMTYPDYRLVETVEDWYQTALDELSAN